MLFMEKRKWVRAGYQLIRKLPAKTAHEIGTFSLQNRALRPLVTPKLPETIRNMGIRVPGIGYLKHPIGLAPGLDMDGKSSVGFAKLGFSFIEIGSVTPRPTPGQHRPQIFTHNDQQSLLKTQGFANDGVIQTTRRLNKLRWDHEATPLGINLAKDPGTRNTGALDDLLQSLEYVKHTCRYTVINLPSPQVAGTFELASIEFVQQLAIHAKNLLPKIWLKLDPNMEKKAFQALIATITSEGFQGVVLTNSRSVSWPSSGSLSGAPLSIMANARLEWAWEVHKGQLPMVASGGILNGTDIMERIVRGAYAAQLYTACIQRGPWAVSELLDELAAEMRIRQVENLEDVRGSYYSG